MESVSQLLQLMRPPTASHDDDMMTLRIARAICCVMANLSACRGRTAAASVAAAAERQTPSSSLQRVRGGCGEDLVQCAFSRRITGSFCAVIGCGCAVYCMMYSTATVSEWPLWVSALVLWSSQSPGRAQVTSGGLSTAHKWWRLFTYSNWQLV